MTNSINRRDLCVALSAFAAMGPVTANAASTTEVLSEGQAEKEQVMAKSVVYSYSKMPVVQLPNGGDQHRVLSGTLATGEFVGVHETMLPPGKMPHPPHKHRNSELLCIQEGKLEFINDGVPQPVGPGDVVFTASNVMHGLKNVGTTPARYFVIEISRP